MSNRERYRAGDQIGGKYELVRKLETGGMGSVWAAKNQDLDVHVAVKLLRPELAETHAAERLLAEARMLARLQHPAIVRVHDCGRTPHGDPFVVMELLDGESLADFIDRRGRIPATEAVSLLLPILDGVRAAHELGIVHRDIKPENIFLAKGSGRTQPKLLDFGIALAEAVGVRRTTHGAILGSPVYMSPEQARGAQVDASTDLWALAVVLFELITFALPFQGDNYNAVLRSIIEDECPSLTAHAAGDQLLAAIVERALDKQRTRRFANAKELGGALAEWLLAQGVTEDVSHVSLRASWLGSKSEPPSLRPVVVGRTEPPPALSSTASVPSQTTSPPVVAADDQRRSVEGLSLTSKTSRRAPLWMALSALGALCLTLGAFWLRSGERPPGVASARSDAAVSPEPRPVASAALPVREVLAPERESDAGVREPSPARPPAPSKARRPSERPSEAFRPKGI
ncbi:MAG: serine/threonine-protein kinase [Polyangiaceae bacterium]